MNLAGFGLISDSGLTLFVSGIMNWNIQKGNGVMSILSTREWATLIWGCIFLLYVLYHKEIRKSFWNIVVRFFDKKLRILWEIIFLYVQSFAYLGEYIYQGYCYMVCFFWINILYECCFE